MAAMVWALGVYFSCLMTSGVVITSQRYEEAEMTEVEEGNPQPAWRFSDGVTETADGCLNGIEAWRHRQRSNLLKTQ
jgi:hypothetical protein